MKNKPGLLVVISGPSGAGKGTVLKELLAENQNIVYSVSATTRHPRAGETDGEHYHFVSKEAFRELIVNGEMLEHAEYNENYYGTPRSAVNDARGEGKDVILEIEVQGAFSVKKKCPDAVFIFIMPPSLAELRRRLTDRQTETEGEIAGRMAAAVREISLAHNYDYMVINDDVSVCVKEISSIIAAEKQKIGNMKDYIDQVLSEQP